MDDSSKKSGKRKELGLGQLKAIAADVASVLDTDADDVKIWNEFFQLPQSERRKVLDLIPRAADDVPREKFARLARMTLSGGAATRHEAALKSVAAFSGKCSRDSAGTQLHL